MSALPKPMSLEEFIAWEERQEPRYEFDGAEIEEVEGGTMASALIQANLIANLGASLRGSRHAVVGGLLKIRTPVSIRYPDAMVVDATTNGKATWTTTPVVIFEILSPSTGPKDLGAKNAEYQTLETLRRYVALQRYARAAEVFFRDAEGEWSHEFVAAEGVLAMPEIGVELPLVACYEGVELTA